MVRMLSLISFLLCLLAPAAQGADTVTVYTNVNFPPLMIDNDHGLYPDLVDYLNRQKPGGLQFKLEHLPRKRMQVLLDEQKLDGAIIGMMPQWFGDEAQKKIPVDPAVFLRQLRAGVAGQRAVALRPGHGARGQPDRRHAGLCLSRH